MFCRVRISIVRVSLSFFGTRTQSYLNSRDMLTPSQVLHLPLGVDRWENELDTQPTLDFVSNTLRNVLQGQTLEPSEPPPIDVLCSHVSKVCIYSSLLGATVLMHPSDARIFCPSINYLVTYSSTKTKFGAA